MSVPTATIEPSTRKATMTTTFDNKVEILAEIFVDENPEWDNYRKFHNLGLPYAYGVVMGYFEPTEGVTRFIEQTWDWTIADHKIEDKGFESFEDLLLAIQQA